MTLRAAIIGCGKIGSEFSDDTLVRGIYSHAGAYSASKSSQLVAACDTDDARAARCATRWGLPKYYTDVRLMLAEVQPDVVSVCSPDRTHASVLRDVLSFPCVRGVLAEKPLALTSGEASEINELARSHGVKLAVNYIRRYASGHQRVRDLIAAGGIGTIQTVSGLYSRGLVHNGSHWIDLVRWLIGEIASVQGFAVPGDQITDPSEDVRFTFVNGARAILSGCRAEAFAVFDTDIVGTAGRVRLYDLGHKISVHDVRDSPYYSGYRNLVPKFDDVGGLTESMQNAVENLLACVRDGGEPVCSGSDGVAAVRIAETARASANTGRPIVLCAAES